MAIRYSGDAEVRLRWDNRRHLYIGNVRDPYIRWRGSAPQPSEIKKNSPTNPYSYDSMAALFLRQAQKWARQKYGRDLQLEEKHGRIQIRRVFQAPCPIGRIPHLRKGFDK